MPFFSSVSGPDDEYETVVEFPSIDDGFFLAFLAQRPFFFCKNIRLADPPWNDPLRSLFIALFRASNDASACEFRCLSVDSPPLSIATPLQTLALDPRENPLPGV